ncbi:hypothetical protein EO087_02935 [Dyella sp. M7H15-1]|uniref:hypothetical protein n=1 Tax=Dyella sp. M7H15-1 TaxID=2501295 RepID=UPI001004F12A|nr:hypothetical protein [Dyella sp. M7H15-1]QAU23072.1 hypothetical protein EO087_02935 [Dyella sp. M7H15-1]
MTSQHIWFFARLTLLVLGLIGFAGFLRTGSNFDPLAGLICGAVVFLFVQSTVSKYSTRKEDILSLVSPFWSPWKYPQTYWFTLGALVVICSVVNLFVHVGIIMAIRLYSGLTLFGVGILAGSIFARRRLRKT